MRSFQTCLSCLSLFTLTTQLLAVKTFDEKSRVQNFLKSYETSEGAKDLDMSWVDDVLSNIELIPSGEQDNKLYWRAGREDPDVNNIEWKDCSSKKEATVDSSAAAAAVHIQDLTLLPSPLHLPGIVKVSFTIDVTGDIDAPVELEVSVSKKIGFVFIHVKTIHNDDLCSLIMNKTCPTVFEHCHCPFPQGVYKLPLSSFNVNPPQHIPGGEYRFTVRLLQPAGRYDIFEAREKVKTKEVGCLFVELSIKS